jgi:hypothetical protein
MERVVEPEWLDGMPTTEAGAICSRRDLQRLNLLMGNAGIVRATLTRIFAGRHLARLVELGAGDGTFLLRLARALSPRWPDVRVTLVDRRPCVSAATRAGFAAAGWSVEAITADVFDWLPEQTGADVIVANLFLHHFEKKPLEELLALAASKCSGFVACEPRRGLPALWMSRLLWLIGCHSVTRHDAVISVRAGFRDRELSARWPAAGWNLREERAGAFGHLFAASRPQSR